LEIKSNPIIPIITTELIIVYLSVAVPLTAYRLRVSCLSDKVTDI